MCPEGGKKVRLRRPTQAFGVTPYIHTHEGWIFLAAILDFFSRKIVGRAMSDSIDLASQKNSSFGGWWMPIMESSYESTKPSFYSFGQHALPM